MLVANTLFIDPFQWVEIVDQLIYHKALIVDGSPSLKMIHRVYHTLSIATTKAVWHFVPKHQCLHYAADKVVQFAVVGTVLFLTCSGPVFAFRSTFETALVSTAAGPAGCSVWHARFS